MLELKEIFQIKNDEYQKKAKDLENKVSLKEKLKGNSQLIKNEIANISGNLLIEKTNNLFPNGFKGKKIELSDFYLPWERIHELGFKLEFIEN